MQGQKYRISDTIQADINVPTEGATVDLLVGTCAAAVPMYVEYAQINCGVNAAQIQKLGVVMRSTAGSGAGGSLGARNTSPSGPAASTTWNYMVTTPGTVSGSPFWCEDWQQFGGFEYDRVNDPEFVPAGSSWAIPLALVSAGFTCNINVINTECK